MLTPYLTTRNGVLFETDCLEIMRSLRDGIFHCIFADPPFNLGKIYNNGYDDNQEKEQYHAWCREWLTEGARLLKKGGAFFVYATPELAIRFAGHLNTLLTFRHWIALTMKGTYRRGNKLYPAHYALLYYTKDDPKRFNELRVPIPTCRHCGKEIKDYGGHRDKLNDKGLNLTDFWEDTSPNRHKKFKVRQGVNELKLIIPERAVLISTKKNDLVFDPFGGGGSTYQVAEKHGRRWIGTELYDCRHIKTRLTEICPDSIDQQPQFDYQGLFRNENNQSEILRRSTRKGLPAGVVAPVP
jgi:site-specific DNA-methyltransferase (adenine-specific)